jgi:hypothetical protein
LLPLLEGRGKNMMLKERKEITQEMFLRAMAFYDDGSANLISTPKETNMTRLTFNLTTKMTTRTTKKPTASTLV